MAPRFKNPNSDLMSHLALHLKDQFTIITSEFGKLNPCHIKKEEKKKTKKTPKDHPTEAMWPSWLLFVCLAPASSCFLRSFRYWRLPSLLPPDSSASARWRPSSAGVWLSVSLHVTQIILAWCAAIALVGGLVSLVQQRELKAPPPAPTPRHQDWNLSGGRSSYAVLTDVSSGAGCHTESILKKVKTSISLCWIVIRVCRNCCVLNCHLGKAQKKKESLELCDCAVNVRFNSTAVDTFYSLITHF